jgi:hypothetical protein
VESFGSHAWAAEPEQQAVWTEVAAPPLVQVQVPPVQMPVAQSLFSAQVAPVTSGGAHVPAAQ